MTHNNLLLLVILPFTLLTKTPEVDNVENVAQELIVFHHDFTKMQEIKCTH